MPRTRPPYPEEYRQRIIELHHAGRSIESLAREFEPTPKIQPAPKPQPVGEVSTCFPDAQPSGHMPGVAAHR